MSIRKIKHKINELENAPIQNFSEIQRMKQKLEDEERLRTLRVVAIVWTSIVVVCTILHFAL
ncbi:MAG: hypothetical protein FGM14_15100 [Flavobacteriales bacterium]|nr:hypothetical protein [Flavobacteriales bacterium]